MVGPQDCTMEHAEENFGAKFDVTEKQTIVEFLETKICDPEYRYVL